LGYIRRLTMSANEDELAKFLSDNGVSASRPILGSTSALLNYSALYGVTKKYVPDFWLESANLYIEVKGQMTLHQVSKLIYVLEAGRVNLYLYQATEEDWDPTIEPLVPVAGSCPDSRFEAKRKKYNKDLQQREILYLSSNVTAVERVNKVTLARLRAYIGFFNDHLHQACGRGLL
jgi:hypothetical protein